MERDPTQILMNGVMRLLCLDEKIQQVESYFLGKGVSLEQFFLDLHNGNIIKGFGKWLLDIIAIFLLLISISGIWIWLRKKALLSFIPIR